MLDNSSMPGQEMTSTPPDQASAPGGHWMHTVPVPKELCYFVAIEHERSGLTIRYEAEAPTRDEAVALLRGIEDERTACPDPAAEKCSEHTSCPELVTQRETNEALERRAEWFVAKAKELKVSIAGLRHEASERIIAEEKRKTERDELRAALQALVVEAQSHMACLYCQGRYGKEHSPTCPVEKAARLLAENSEKGARDGA